MQTQLAGFVKTRKDHDELEAILKSCVHCGFCNATCPTYQLTGNELDGPRGRIYLLKQMLEGEPMGRTTQHHLDRCLNCLACETSCPSGVKYGRLLDIGREIVDKKVSRPFYKQIIRKLILTVFPYKHRFNGLIRMAIFLKPVLPDVFKKKIPKTPLVRPWPAAVHKRQVLLLSGCVQSSLRPEIDLAAAHVLDELGISLVSLANSQCCGALSYHLSEHDQAKQFAKQTIDLCWPYITQNIEAMIMTSSGCGVMLKDYATLLQYDEQYAEKSRLFSEKVKDISEILRHEDLSIFAGKNKTIAFQSPCTLQHGQKLNGVVEGILQKIGYSLAAINDPHLCCGSAGVYSLLQPKMSEQLKQNKLIALHKQQPDLIATANIGCLMHLQDSARVNVVHWLELLYEQ